MYSNKPMAWVTLEDTKFTIDENLAFRNLLINQPYKK